MKKIIYLLLSLLLILPAAAAVMAEGPYFYECNVSDIDFSEATVKASAVAPGDEAGAADVSNGKLKLYMTKALPGREDVGVNIALTESLSPQSDKYYVFSTTFESDNTSDTRHLFTYNGETAYQNYNCLATIKGNYICDSQTNKIKEISPNTEYTISIVYKGKFFDSIYINNEKQTTINGGPIETNQRFAYLPVTLSKIGFLQVSWSPTISLFGDISVKEVDSLALTSPKNMDNCSIYSGGVDLEFNNFLENPGTAVLTDENGASIAATGTVYGKILRLTPQKTLAPNKKYTLAISGVVDAFGGTYSANDISVTTVTTDPSYIDEDFASSDGVGDFIASTGTLSYEAGALKHALPANGISTLSYGSPVSVTMSEGIYVSELDYKTSVAQGNIHFFRYGEGESDYLFRADGLWLKLPDGTALHNRKINADGDNYVTFSAVYNYFAGTFDIYCDYVKINTDPIPLSADNFKSAYSLTRKAPAAGAEDMIDNVRFYKLSRYSAMKLLSSSVAEGDTVKTYLKDITLDFSQEISQPSLSEVTLKDTKNNPVGITASVDGSDAGKVIISINEVLTANTDYVLDISAIRGDAPLYKTGKISFATEDSINVSAPDFTGSTAVDMSGNLQSGELNVSVNVNNDTYTGETDTATLMILVYKGYKLTDIKTVSVSSLSDTDTELSAAVTIGSDLTDVYAKVYVVDSLNTMCPLTSATTIE